MSHARRLAEQYGGPLNVLKDLQPVQLDLLLPHLKSGLVGAIDNCCHNCLANPRVLPPQARNILKKKLKKYKNNLSGVLDGERRGTLKQQRAYLYQRGSGASIIAAALSAAVPLVLDLLSKKKK